MAEQKRQQGRPKKTENVRASNEKIETQKDEKTENEKVSDLPPMGMFGLDKPRKVVKEKVIEVKTKQAKKPKLSFSERKNNSFDVIVKGKLRAMSRQAYEAVSKDPQLKVSLPKGSPLAANLEAKEKPCEDC